MIKGWDWMELAEEWNVYIPEDYFAHEKFDDFNPVQWYIREVLTHYDGVSDTMMMRKMGNDVRKFLCLIGSAEITCSYQLWVGMSNIKDNYTILSYTYILIGHMWD